MARRVAAGDPSAASFSRSQAADRGVRSLITPVGPLPPTQTATTFEGTTAGSDDKQYFSFSVPTTRPVRVEVIRVGGDFAKVEIENAATSADVLELEPNDGVSSRTVTLTGGTPYLLRVRAADDSAAQYRVVLTQL